MHSPALIVGIQKSQNDNAWCDIPLSVSLYTGKLYDGLLWRARVNERDRQRKLSVTKRIAILQVLSVLQKGDSWDSVAVWSTPMGTRDSREGKCNNSMTRRGCQLQSAQDRGAGSDTLKTAASLDSRGKALHQWAASPLEMWAAMWESKQYPNCEW